MTFSESLKRFRQEGNLTQRQIAEKLDMKQQLYFRYETGATTPSVNFLTKLATTYGVSTDYLLGLTDDPTPHWRCANPAPENSPAVDDTPAPEMTPAEIVGRFERIEAALRKNGIEL